VYVSEREAQELAVKLRQGAPAGTALVGLNALLDTTLRDIFQHGLYSKAKLNHRIAVLWPVSGYALRRLPPAVTDQLRHQLSGWLGRALADFLGSRSSAFVQATEDVGDGVTFTITLARVPGLDRVDRLLLGQDAGAAERLFTGDPPTAEVTAAAGFQRG
jgi:hypothetical protein